jgi:hypothetical protein
MARVPAIARQRFGDNGIGLSVQGPVFFKVASIFDLSIPNPVG